MGAEKSGLGRQDGYLKRHTNDEPGMGFQINQIDNGTLNKMIETFAVLQGRNYVVMHVKDNLIKDERAKLLAKFPSKSFKKVAHVQLGEPPAEFKQKTHEVMLKAKQTASDVEFTRKQAEEKRKKLAEKKRKEVERAQKKALKAKEKQAKELKKKQDAEKKEAAKKKAAEDGNEEESKEEEKVEEKEEEEEEPEEVEEEEKEEEEKDEQPPKVELSDEEKKQFFIKKVTSDLTPFHLSTNFAKFSVPEKAEGFDDVKFSWADGAKSKAYLTNWIQKRKNSTRVEELVAGAWFRQKSAEWDKTVQQWHAKLNQYKSA